MNYFPIAVLVIDLVGATAGIVALFQGASTFKRKLGHAVWAISLLFFAGSAVWAQERLSRIHRVQHAASALIKDAEFETTDVGFTQSALTFLESTKDLYPDTYARAQELCRLNDCYGKQYGATNSNSVDFSYNQINVRSALMGLLRGI